MPLIALALIILGSILGFLVAQVTLYHQPHAYHLFGMTAGALLGRLTGRSSSGLQRKHSP